MLNVWVEEEDAKDREGGGGFLVRQSTNLGAHSYGRMEDIFIKADTVSTLLSYVTLKMVKSVSFNTNIFLTNASNVINKSVIIFFTIMAQFGSEAWS